MSEWQPIETAPKDGTSILASFSGRVMIAEWDRQRHHSRPRPFWNSLESRIWGVGWMRDNQPSFWMPLPDPPKSENAA